MTTVSTINPDAKKFPLDLAADELARLTELRDATDEAIAKLRTRIIADLGPLTQEHTQLKGRKTLWDVRYLPTATIAWKKVSEHLNAPKDIIAMYTQSRLQVSFKRLPPEISK